MKPDRDLKKIPFSEMTELEKKEWLLFLELQEKKNTVDGQIKSIGAEIDRKVSITFGRKVTKNMAHAFKDSYDFHRSDYIGEEDSNTVKEVRK